MSYNSDVNTIKVCDLFVENVFYEIPLYQRAYAWGDDQIRNLIEDISDVELEDENSKYCLGSLIVARDGSRFEVIDGQQRLTTLYLLLNILNMKADKCLSFACREKSSITLLEIDDILLKEAKKINDSEMYQDEILKGIKWLKKYLPQGGDLEEFKKKLNHVVIYRIQVPEHTDLNHYFEIMNTRGEQLEQTDVLKARLMGYLSKDDRKRTIFAKIWNACSDMNGYVQMHFSQKDRNIIFSGDWNELPNPSYKKGYLQLFNKNSSVIACSIKDVIKNGIQIEKTDGIDDEDHNVRFESVIEFKHFLLHTLKVYVSEYLNENPDALVLKQIDDKKLIENFENVEKNGVIEGQKISNHKDVFAFSFIICLLRCRFLFDKYIIKREYVDEDKIGIWSLRELKVSGQQSKKKPYYVNTAIQKKHDRDKERGKRCLMLQAALRVSYTSPKVMHWITNLLLWLMEDGYSNVHSNLDQYEDYIESIIRESIKTDFLMKSDEEKFEMGLNTPHLVFNYLDYQLWKESQKKYEKFVFEFRNSVEHWYPRNPSKGTFPKWEHKDGVDQFGNLCLVPSNINSSFSNLDPEAKKKTFKEEVAKGSLKLRLMAKLTDDPNNASLKWRNEECIKHGESMITLLKKACEMKGDA